MVEVRVEASPPEQVEASLLAVGLLEGGTWLNATAAAVDRALGEVLSGLIADGEISGAPGAITVVHVPRGAPVRARRVAVVGLGPADQLDLEAFRVAAATAAHKAQDLGVAALALALHDGAPSAPGHDLQEACTAVVEAALLALYRYRPPAREDPPVSSVRDLIVLEGDAARVPRLTTAVAQVERTCAAVGRVRDLSTGPANIVTPAYLAEQAEQVARELGLEITVWGPDELKTHGMRTIVAVGQGSVQPPRFVVLRYRPSGASKTLAVVGKGVTFDSGGLSIKPAERMQYARHDMSGAAAVIGFLQLAAASHLPIAVLGIIAAVENMPSGSAYRPGDVYRTYNGTTIEVINTDAEGRLILADALAYAAEQGPDAIVDLATLTGATRVAVGDHATGLFSNDQRLASLLIEAGDRSGERLWQFPLWPVYRHALRTPMADLRNVGGQRAGGIVAALLLERFVGHVPWAHLDMGGTGYVDDSQQYVPPYLPARGGTGVGVRLLWHFCHLWSAP